MSHIANPHPHDPRNRQRSHELTELLARCPEHLFSTDDDEMTPVARADETPDAETAALEKAA